MSRMGKFAWVFVLVIGSIVLDQITKWAVDNWMVLNTSIPILSDFLRLTYIRNPNAAFGIKIGSIGRYIFSIVSIVVIIGVILNFRRLAGGRRLNELALAMILGGAFGNTIDRIMYGEVVDFIDVGINRTRWPVFNVADSLVTVGVLILALMIYLDAIKRDKKETYAPEGGPSP